MRKVPAASPGSIGAGADSHRTEEAGKDQKLQQAPWAHQPHPRARGRGRDCPRPKKAEGRQTLPCPEAEVPGKGQPTQPPALGEADANGQYRGKVSKKMKKRSTELAINTWMTGPSNVRSYPKTTGLSAEPLRF